ncbi:hypothetical protein C8J57DRAFT_1265289, partial [Mycena rebaudengoi]
RVHKLELLEFPAYRNDLLPFASFSGLKVLMLAAQGPDANASIPVASLLAMLRDAPGIVECTLDNLYTDEDDDPHQKEPMILPSLQYLALGSGPYNYCSTFTLEYLSLPALRNLVMWDLDIDITHLISFFTQSEAPLRSLSINSCYNPWNPHAATQLFGLMPTLADLGLIEFAISNVTTVLELLSYSPQRFLLPQLRALDLDTIICARWPQNMEWKSILDVGMVLILTRSVGVCLHSKAYKYFLNTILALSETSGPCVITFLVIHYNRAFDYVLSMFMGNNCGSFVDILRTVDSRTVRNRLRKTTSEKKCNYGRSSNKSVVTDVVILTSEAYSRSSAQPWYIRLKLRNSEIIILLLV